jgi:hypothetical protein
MDMLSLYLSAPDTQSGCHLFLADLAFLVALFVFNAAFFFLAVFAVPAFLVIGMSQQINSHVLQPQGSSTQTTIPHSSPLLDRNHSSLLSFL